jgi:hypothetical protein
VDLVYYLFVVGTKAERGGGELISPKMTKYGSKHYSLWCRDDIQAKN